MCDFTEKYFNMGRECGKEEGIEEGREEANRSLAGQMLKDKQPIANIMKYTGLTKEQIELLPV